MTRICVLSDAHLLHQAEWTEKEDVLVEAATEVIENFDRAMAELVKEHPDAIIMVGDMFDTKTKSGQRVAYREAEKYLSRVIEVLRRTTEEARCKIYVLRGNHDSEPSLRSIAQIMSGQLVYAKNQTIRVGKLSVAFMDTHYLTGIYEIPEEDIPGNADLLFIHESVPLPKVSAPDRETFVTMCARFQKVFNGHMHYYKERLLDIPNFYLLPAFVPSRSIKNNWMVRYRSENSKVVTDEQDSPFGYVVIDDGNSSFVRYTPSQIIVRAEILGKKVEDFIKGVQSIYELLIEREDAERLRVWITTNADQITIDRLLWDQASRFQQIRTMDIISERSEAMRGPAPKVEEIFGDTAFTRSELLEKLLLTMKGERQKMAVRLLDEIFTMEVLQSKNPSETQGFKRLLELASEKKEVSPLFVERAWALVKGR